METDLGAEKVRSRPGRWWKSPSLSSRPSPAAGAVGYFAFEDPSGTGPGRPGLQGRGSSAPLPAHALASLWMGSSLA